MNKTMHIMHVSICYSGWMNNGKLTSWHPMSVKCDELILGILGDWLGDLGGKPGDGGFRFLDCRELFHSLLEDPLDW